MIILILLQQSQTAFQGHELGIELIVLAFFAVEFIREAGVEVILPLHADCSQFEVELRYLIILILQLIVYFLQVIL